MTRTGPRMIQVTSYVARHPGCPKIRPAEDAGPRGSLRYGYASVNRALRAGLIEDRSAGRSHSRGYELHVTPLGREALGH